MGQETELAGMAESEQLEYTRRMAELYAEIALTDILLHGAAISSLGIHQYPIIAEHIAGTLSTEHAELFAQGRITTVRPDEIKTEVNSSSNPPIIFLIPPGSIASLVSKEFSRGGRELSPSIMLYHGLDEDNRPITDSITGNPNLTKGLRHVVLDRIKQLGIDLADLKKSPTTIIKEALTRVADINGLGNIDDVVKKALEEITLEHGIAVSVAQSIINGERKS